MWGAIWNFVDGFVSTHGALVALAATWLWNHISSSKRAWVEDKVAKVADAAWNLAMLESDIGIPLPTLIGLARDKAHDMVAKLDIPLSKSVLALIDHELDLLAGRAAAEHLSQQMADAADAAASIPGSVWGDAAARGAAAVAGASDVVSTTIVPQDAALDHQTTEQALATLVLPSSDANAASSLHATSGSTDSPTTASPARVAPP